MNLLKRNKKRKKNLLSITICFCLVSLQTLAIQPKNIILMIGDGMGPAYTTAYRYYKDDPTTPEVEITIFDELLTGSSSTYPITGTTFVTDSAAAATALSCGTKSYNGAIAVIPPYFKPCKTMLEYAGQYGKATGIAVTSSINHATPACFYAHNIYRGNYKNIFYDYLDSVIDERTRTGWTTAGHTAIDVQIFAYGAGAEKFSGHLDNTEIAKTLLEFIKTK